jgi:hypothetical protein
MESLRIKRRRAMKTRTYATPTSRTATTILDLILILRNKKSHFRPATTGIRKFPVYIYIYIYFFYYSYFKYIEISLIILEKELLQCCLNSHPLIRRAFPRQQFFGSSCCRFAENEEKMSKAVGIALKM